MRPDPLSSVPPASPAFLGEEVLFCGSFSSPSVVSVFAAVLAAVQENMKKVNELTNSPPPDDAPAARAGAGTDMMGLLSSMVSTLTTADEEITTAAVVS